MLLNSQYSPESKLNHHAPILLIHGLFGSLSNLAGIGRELSSEYNIVQIDVRNHGLSPHSSEMTYAAMAEDVIETLDALNIQAFSTIGHSMGGKLAMKLTEIAEQRLQNLIILDMAPVAYHENHHDQIFKALFAVEKANIETRKDAMSVMREFIQEEMVIQFLLKSFSKGQWLFNVNALYQHYADILDWTTLKLWNKPTLFIRGENSPYISKQGYIDEINKQFSKVNIETVEGAGHWLHAEKPEQVMHFIRAFLKNN